MTVKIEPALRKPSKSSLCYNCFRRSAHLGWQWRRSTWRWDDQCCSEATTCRCLTRFLFDLDINIDIEFSLTEFWPVWLNAANEISTITSIQS